MVLDFMPDRRHSIGFRPLLLLPAARSCTPRPFAWLDPLQKNNAAALRVPFFRTQKRVLPFVFQAIYRKKECTEEAKMRRNGCP